MSGAIQLDDLKYLLLNVTPLVRRVLRIVDRHFPESDEALARYLLIACNNPGTDQLTRNVYSFCERYGGRLPGTTGDEGTARHVRNWLLTARTLAEISARAQSALPRVTPGEDYELVFYIARVEHDASVGCTEQVQTSLPPSVIATPYGLVEQGEERRERADELRAVLAAGGHIPVFRIVSAFGNHLQWSPFWTIGSPAFDPTMGVELERHLIRGVAPPSRLAGPLLLARGAVRRGARFVVEPGVSFARSCEMGADTLITTFDGVELDHNDEVVNFIRQGLKPARIGVSAE